MKRVVLSVSNDITNDQRLNRVCQMLHQNNYDVFVIGRKKQDSKSLKYRYKTYRFSMLFSKGFLFYASFNIKLFFFLLFTKKDILYANDTDTLLANFFVSRIQNKPLIFDSHELFSEVPELVNRPFQKKVWRKIEDFIIPKLKNIITVSPGIQRHYKTLYNVESTILKNVPITKEVIKKELKEIPKNKKIIWYQGAVNLGRGLELLIKTIPLLKNYVLIIAGNGDILDQLEQKVLSDKLENKVFFLGKLDPKELKQLTPNATIGVSLEEDLGLNYRYALPNKVFDYIHANVPVITSSLPNMSSLVKQYKIGEILVERSSESLSKLILKMEQKDYSSFLENAKKELNWNREQINLLKLLKAV